MVTAKADGVERHLVLGGSSGIGFAYAMRLARSGASLALVGRRVSALERAGEDLLEGGAAEVQLHAGDILDVGFRRSLFDRYETAAFASVFVGGPSPPAGQFREVLPEDYLSACRIVLEYPVSVLEWALGPAVASGGRVILLSSSAAGESLGDHPFFLSSLLRRALDLVVNSYLAEFRRLDRNLVVWRPKVVLTSLAASYAASHPDSETMARLREVLLSRLGEEPVTAEEFVKKKAREE